MTNISGKTRKMLWGRSAGLCSICRKQLFEDDRLADDPAVLGEECHIVGEKNSDDSPRGRHPLPESKRNKFDNLILLCHDHHKIIDDRPEEYTVEELHRIKNEHLVFVRSNFGFDESKQSDDEVYAGFVDVWSNKAGLDDWDDFTYLICAGDTPSVKKERWEALEQLHDWLFKRVYPKRYPKLGSALENFRIVLHDFRNVFTRHTDPDSFSGNIVRTLKFYKIDEWNQELYNKLGKQYDEHICLLKDLVLELTRAANYVCDCVRQDLTPSFRLEEGLLIAHTGTWPDGVDRSIRVAYQADGRTDSPYPGLEHFMTARRQRDFSFANGE